MLSFKRKSLFCALLGAMLFCSCAYRETTVLPPTADISVKTPCVVEGIWQVDDVDVSSVRTDKKLVALTFDDAPTGKLDALLDVFLSFNKSHPDAPACATLFCNGRGFFHRTKESLYTAHALGLELANHSFSHKRLSGLSIDEIKGEISQVDTLLQEIDGKPLHLFRAPYGSLSTGVIASVQAPVIDWFVDTEDWAHLSPQKTVDRVFERLEDGAIVLMHDGYDSTVEGVRRLLPALLQAGYQAVSVSQLAKAHSVPLYAGKVYTRARKHK